MAEQHRVTHATRVFCIYYKGTCQSRVLQITTNRDRLGIKLSVSPNESYCVCGSESCVGASAGHNEVFF